MLLTCIFDAPPDPSRNPFGLGLPSSAQFPDLGDDLHPRPVAAFQLRNTELTFRVPLPVRTFVLSDRSAHPEFSPGGLPERQPDSPSLPASVS